MDDLCDCMCGCDVDLDHRITCEYSHKVERAALPVETRCCECKEIIPPGTPHEFVAGEWGEWKDMETWLPWPLEIFHTCIACQAIRDDYCLGGFSYGFLRETLLECEDFDYLAIHRGGER